MVIFGAGASYDSAQAYPVPASYPGGSQNFGTNASVPVDGGGPWRPPLTKDLFINREGAFGDIVAKYPKLNHILPYLRKPRDRETVEHVLEFLQEQGKNSPETLRELASVQYYLCELLGKMTVEWSRQTNGTTNYGPLIRDILEFNRKDEEVCLVTFNYDLLLEQSLYSFGFGRKTPQEHLDSHPTLKLLKLHGSIDWSRTVEAAGMRLQPQALIEQAPGLQVSSRFVLANAATEWFQSTQGSIFPAIAIPVQTKTEDHFACPTAHREYLEQKLDWVTKILIIGWQGKEAHFLRMLRNKLPLLTHVMVVGQHRPDSEEVMTRFLADIQRTDLPPRARFFGTGGFTRFIVEREGDGFFTA